MDSCAACCSRARWCSSLLCCCSMSRMREWMQRTRTSLRALVQRAWDSGVTVVIATHHRDEWPRGATHELELAGSRVVYCGPVRRVGRRARQALRMRSRAALIGVGMVALCTAAVLLWLRWQRQAMVRAARRWSSGGDAGGLPRVPPQQEHLDPAALEAGSGDAAAEGLQVMIVVRHDYIVYERYGHGFSADTDDRLRRVRAVAAGAGCGHRGARWPPCDASR